MNLDFAGLIADILFPPVCVSCTKRIRRGVLCDLCRGRLAVRGNPLTAISNGATSYLIGAAGNYEDKTMQALIHALKFRFVKDAALPLAEVLCRYVNHICTENALDLSGFVVMPLPLSPERKRMRGFNQAELIASWFTYQTGLSLDTQALLRIRHRKPQSETRDIAERRANIAGCFAAVPERCAGKNIILIDDVTTSGSTFLEAARALNVAGAKKTIALAVARA